MAMYADSSDLPTDVLVEILVRLPSSSRRRARLVCRLWRDLVTEHTTEMQSRPRPLLWNLNKAVAYVVDDLSPSSTGSCTELWRTTAGRSHDLQLVGTCNGILCLCNNNSRERLGGAITLANPVTGETLPIPPLQCPAPPPGNHSRVTWGDAYCFTYHPITGRFKVVHVPCSHGKVLQFGAVHVLTLGDTSWREVPAGPAGAECNLPAGVVSIDGTVYWVQAVGDDEVAKIVSFDLENEYVTSTTMPLPPLPAGCEGYRLVEVHGRLGVVTDPDVWVLEEGWRWCHWYRFEGRVPRQHFVYGEYVLTCKGSLVYGHRTKGRQMSGWRLTCDDVAHVCHMDERTLVAEMTYGHRVDKYKIFTYAETTEPLGGYVRN